MIPIIIILVGPTFQAQVITCVLVVFFVAFFNAFEGGRTIALPVIQNAKLLGASPWHVIWHIRMPYSIAWTLAVLPLITTFAFISVVTSEILTGYPGLGRLLATASDTGDSTLTFAVVIALSVVGLTVVLLASSIKRRVLHWWIVGWA
jgi:NitT/TauT family transport system permease protein